MSRAVKPETLWDIYEILCEAHDRRRDVVRVLDRVARERDDARARRRDLEERCREAELRAEAAEQRCREAEFARARFERRCQELEVELADVMA